MESLQIRLWLKRGEISLVEAWASEQSKGMTSPANSSAALPFSAETGLFARVRVLLAREDYPAALSMLDALASSALAGDRKDSLIKILILTAVARQFAGEAGLAGTDQGNGHRAGHYCHRDGRRRTARGIPGPDRGCHFGDRHLSHSYMSGRVMPV
jgi:hypothetical protein